MINSGPLSRYCHEVSLSRLSNIQAWRGCSERGARAVPPLIGISAEPTRGGCRLNGIRVKIRLAKLRLHEPCENASLSARLPARWEYSPKVTRRQNPLPADRTHCSVRPFPCKHPTGD